MPVILLLGLAYSSAFANVIYVDDNAVGSNAGDSWSNAYVSLQAAITDANSTAKPVEIWVAAGTYTPTYDYGLGIGTRGKHFRMINGVAICGGFPNTGNPVWTDRNPDTNTTTLSGDLNGDDGPDFTNNSDNCYHVFCHPDGMDLDATSILDGFTIAGGNADDLVWWPYDSGGGMFNQYCNPRVTNCTFSGNTAFYGGGMGNYASNPTVMNCTFSNNSAAGDVLYEPSGGGMFNEYCNPMVTNCTFTGNTAHYGGGMDNFDSSNPSVTNCTFSNNTASGDPNSAGGGMNNCYSNPLVFNCTFSSNTARYGGGMNNLSSSPFVTDCTFNDNTASSNTDSSGGGMSNFLEEGSSVISNPTVMDCIFSDNSAVYGAGMENEYRDPTVTDCIFSGNTAEDGGGGMYNFFSSPTVTECTFNGNTALYGGGISNEDSNSLVVNCIFSGNLAVYGGGMENYSNCNSTVTNCTFSGNTADTGGGMDNYMSNPSLSNSIFWGNTATSGGDEINNDDTVPASTPVIAFSDIAGCLIGGVTWDASLGTDNGGNVDADPLFIQPPDDGVDGWDDANNDYGDLQLRGGSPCIDAGNNTTIPTEVTTDLDGGSRFVDDPTVEDTGSGTAPIVDIGAYESVDPCLGRDKADFDCNGIVNMADFVYFASHWLQ